MPCNVSLILMTNEHELTVTDREVTIKRVISKQMVSRFLGSSRENTGPVVRLRERLMNHSNFAGSKGGAAQT